MGKQNWATLAGAIGGFNTGKRQTGVIGSFYVMHNHLIFAQCFFHDGYYIDCASLLYFGAESELPARRPLPADYYSIFCNSAAFGQAQQVGVVRPQSACVTPLYEKCRSDLVKMCN